MVSVLDDDWRNILLTAHLFLDKTPAANIPVWILSLDLSKAFDRVDWGALWLALSEHGVSTHLLWILRTLYSGQHGEVTGQGGSSRVVEACHMKTWAETCASQQWTFACYIMSLPQERWVRRMLFLQI